MALSPSANQDGDAAPDERSFFNELRQDHAAFVPVLGSGMSRAAGAPGFGDLVQHLLDRANEAGFAPSLTADDPPFDVVDALAEVLGEEWVQEQTAALYRNCALRLTPALQALTKVASGLIITTNYDLAVEVAAEQASRPFETLTLDEFHRAIAPNPGLLQVLHLHGVCTKPESLVLTNQSYAQILESEEAKLLLRALGVTHRFVFLGQRLDPREAHIRRDLSWAIAAVSPPRGSHMLVTDTASLTDPGTVDFKAELEMSTKIQVVPFPDPDGLHQAAVRTAHAIAPPATVELADEAPQISASELDIHYRPLPMAESAQGQEAGGRGGYRYRLWHEGAIWSTDLDAAQSHLIIEAEGGAGKSQELLQIAHRSSNPALIQHLSVFQLEGSWADPGILFVAGMHGARAARPGMPQMTHARLRDESYTLLLDGLDEVPAARRSALLKLLIDVARTYPQHRIVIGSRPLPELAAQKIFARWTPMTDMAWVRTYAAGRGVDPARLHEALPDTGDISELIVVPIYAAAAVGRVYLDEPLPGSALELVCDLADSHLSKDTRIRATPASTRTWLDRLALAMQLAGVSDVTGAELAASSLHDGLPDLVPDEQTLGELAARALLRDTDSIVRFPANVMKEARAARALLEAGDRGLELLRGHVLIELDARDANGRPVRAVHPAWVNILEMLLPNADERWREEVSSYDPCLVARSTSSLAHSDDRARAVSVLWETYLARQVWLERRATSGNGSGDGDALTRLLSIEVPPEFDGRIRAAAASGDRTARGNAMDLVPYVLPADEALQLLTRSVRDEDAVVRRRAAAAGWTMTHRHSNSVLDNELAREYVDAMADQALHADTDEMARQTLIDVAIDLAPEQQAILTALAATPLKLREHAISSLARRLGRDRILQLVHTDKGIDGDLLHELLEDRSLGRAEPWTTPDIRQLAHIVADLDDDRYWHHDAQDVLAQQPAVSLLTLVEHPAGDKIRLALGGRLVAAMDEIQVEDLLAHLRNKSQPNDLGIETDPANWNADAVAAAIDYLTWTLEARRTLPSPRAKPHGEPIRPAGQRRSAPSGPISDDDVRAVFEDDGVRMGFDQQTHSAYEALLRVLAAGAERDLTLEVDQVLQLFQFLLDWHDEDLETWLSRQWTAAAGDLADSIVRSLDTAQLLRLVAILPGPWTPEHGELVLQALRESDARDGEKTTAALIVGERVGEEFVRERVQGNRGAVWADVALVRMGDCDSEARMIARLTEMPTSIRRHPDAYDEEWISHVRCPASAPLLADLIKMALRKEVSTGELEPLSRALDRTAGLNALGIWEALSLDAEIPSAAFLYYERRIALAALLEQHAFLVRIGDERLSQIAVDTVRPA